MENFLNSKSDEPRLELTSRGGCGRMCEYCPQDSYISEYKEISEGINFLSIDLIRKITKNITNETVISHTGFTEPFDNKDFGSIVDHFYDKGFFQAISTTLYGRKEAQEYFINNLYKFNKSITLHLPDGEGLMKGDFNDKYANYLKNIFEKYIELKRENFEINLTVFLIGENFHSSIKHIVDLYKNLLGQDNIHKAKYLNTRAGAIDPIKFLKKVSQTLRARNATYYCSYKRLNRGVLLPNGDVVICCQDYRLKRVLGSLINEELSFLYNKIETIQQWRESFLNGSFEPCKECEHYRPIGNNFSGNRKD